MASSCITLLPRTLTILACLAVFSDQIGSSDAAPPATNAWEIVHAQTARSAGSHTSPSIRYGHTCVPYRGNIIATHGYYYDREAGAATWRSDTWALNAGTSPHKWIMISPNMPQESAHKSYTAGTVPQAPCGRFGHGSAVVGDAMYMYGGHDGGLSRHNRQNYEPGYDFEELWRLDIEKRAWKFLAIPQGRPSPGKRYLSALAAVGGSLVLYGGMQETQGDVWSYDIAADTWQQLAQELPMGAGGPGRRVGHSLTAWSRPGGPRGVVLYGGRTVEPAPPGSDLPGGVLSILRGDAWFFDLDAKRWRLLANASKIGPPARKYHAAMDLHVPPSAGSSGGSSSSSSSWWRWWSASSRSSGSANAGNASSSGQVVPVGLVAGGTLTAPQLKCGSDAWAFTLDCAANSIAWARLPDMPAALYDLKGAAASGGAYLYGGHLCDIADPKRHPFYYVNEVYKLDLLGSSETGGGGPLPASLLSHGCAIDASALPPSLPSIKLGKRSAMPRRLQAW